MCDEAIKIIEENAFSFKHIDIETNSEELKALKYQLNIASVQNVKFPVLKIEDQLYTNIETCNTFIKILKSHFE